MKGQQLRHYQDIINCIYPTSDISFISAYKRARKVQKAAINEKHLTLLSVISMSIHAKFWWRLHVVSSTNPFFYYWMTPSESFEVVWGTLKCSRNPQMSLESLKSLFGRQILVTSVLRRGAEASAKRLAISTIVQNVRTVYLWTVWHKKNK